MGYVSKRLLPAAAAVNYLIIEIVLLGLCVNKSPFKHLFLKVDFDSTVEDLAFTFIMKRKLNQLAQELKNY